MKANSSKRNTDQSSGNEVEDLEEKRREKEKHEQRRSDAPWFETWSEMKDDVSDVFAEQIKSLHVLTHASSTGRVLASDCRWILPDILSPPLTTGRS